MSGVSQKSKDRVGYVVSAAALLLFLLTFWMANREPAPKYRYSGRKRVETKRGSRAPVPKRIASPQKTPPPRGRIRSMPGSGPNVKVPSPFEDPTPTVTDEHPVVSARSWSGGNNSWGGGEGVRSRASTRSPAGTSDVKRPRTNRRDPPSGGKIMSRGINSAPPKSGPRGETRLASLPAAHRPLSTRRRTELEEEPGNAPLEEAVSSPKEGSQAGVPSVRGNRVDSGSSDPVLNKVMEQFTADRSVMDHVREQVESDQEAGRPIDPARLGQQADEFVKKTGIDPETVDVPQLVARSLQPESFIDPEELGKHAEKLFRENPPPTPEETKEILKKAEKPPKKHEPPPKGALETYNRNRDAFRWAKENLGVEAHHILGILGVETRWGNYTGTNNVLKTLRGISKKEEDTDKGRQATRDLGAVVELSMKGELGGRNLRDLKGSSAGAIGYGQFLPSMWLAYSKDGDGDGGKRDPFNFADVIVSVANYLKEHGYNKSVAKSFFGYNHSQKYVNKVLSLSDRIEADLPKD